MRLVSVVSYKTQDWQCKNKDIEAQKEGQTKKMYEFLLLAE